MTVILQLVSQGATAQIRAGAFPLSEAEASGRLPTHPPAAWRFRPVWTSPARACREIATGLGLSATEDPALADLDHGRWAGRPLAEVAASEPEGIALWINDTGFCGHGGESRHDLSQRVTDFLHRIVGEGRHAVAVTHAAVIRAAILGVLDAPPAAFWALDIAPLTLSELRHDGRRWAIRSVGVGWSRLDLDADLADGL